MKKKKQTKRIINEIMGLTLSNARRIRGETQNTWANALEIPLSTYRNYEQGVSRIDYELIYLIHKRLGVDLTTIIKNNPINYSEANYLLLETKDDKQTDYIVYFDEQIETIKKMLDIIQSQYSNIEELLSLLRDNNL